MKGRWKALLANFPEGATHVDLLFPDQMQRDVNWIGGRDCEYFYRKSSKGQWYKYSPFTSRRKYRQYCMEYQGTSSRWRLITKCKGKYVVSLDTVRLMVKLFENSTGV
ncbi:hypothetical protein VP424E501_P0264 [Vibrio phage 424E50-1]|nr:hypothetical protein VP424E501_P0264 [Vibrio phage 424E50-1]